MKPYPDETMRKWLDEIERVRKQGRCSHRAILWSYSGRKGICMICGEEVKKGDAGKYDPGERWIQRAVGKPGALRGYVARKYGAEGFDAKGRIKKSILKTLSRLPGRVGKRARLAVTLRKIGGTFDPGSKPPPPRDYWIADNVMIRLVPEVDNLFEIAVHVPKDVLRRVEKTLRDNNISFEATGDGVARRGRKHKATNIFILGEG